MGEKVAKFFELIAASGGPTARSRLAMKTSVPSTIAKEVPDTPETIAAFKAAFKEITGKDAPIN